MNQLVLPLVLALAATLATTGCKHGPTKITQLYGQKPPPIQGEKQPETVTSMQPITTEPLPIATEKVQPPGTYPTAEIDLTKYDQDRAALAAHTVHFKFDSSTVQNNEQANIASVAQALASDMNAKLLIEGHCDERGTEEYNRSLGERRALALREALQKAGVDSLRVKTISYGKDKPADPAHDDAAWTKNRRGEFILLHPKAGV